MRYVLAYPELSEADQAWVDAYRRAHDRASCDLVGAHFTLVFGTTVLPEQALHAHVAEIAAQQGPIAFTCRCAMLGTDNTAPIGYVFLVPDEGLSALARLHDALYTGPLAPALRLDIPFVPHITIGTQPSLAEAKGLCDDLNQTDWQISGRVTCLSVVERHQDRVDIRAEIPLTGQLA